MKLGTNVVYKRMRRFALSEKIVLLLFNGVVNVLYVYFMYDSSILMTLLPILESLGCPCNSLIIIQFVSIVMFLNYIFNFINHDLGNCYDVFEDSCRYAAIKSHTGGVSTFRSPGMKLAGFLRNKVHDLRIPYSRLSSVMCLVNSYYEFSILLVVSWLFATVVSVLYVTLFFFVNGTYTDNGAQGYSNISGSVSWCIYCGILMAMITTLCHLVSNETDNTTLCFI
jgi:hypothetical protein